MGVGLYNVTSISMDNLTRVSGNTTNPMNFMIQVNNVVFDGWLFFVLMIMCYGVLFFSYQAKQNQPLNNLFYASLIVTVLSMLLRGITMSQFGLVYGLLSDLQMWVFPIWSALLGATIWAIKD